MTRLQLVSEPSIIPTGNTGGTPRRGPFTGTIGALCMFPLRAIIGACVALGIHPNLLTLTGVFVNVGAAWALGYGRFMLAFAIMLVANIFDFIDGKVAHQLKLQSPFGAFWDSTLDRFSDLALLTGLTVLYSKLGADRLRDGRRAGADLLDHDELRARAPNRWWRSARSGSWNGPSGSCCS